MEAPLQLRSRQWSCSELDAGMQHMIACCKQSCAAFQHLRLKRSWGQMGTWRLHCSCAPGSTVVSNGCIYRSILTLVYGMPTICGDCFLNNELLWGMFWATCLSRHCCFECGYMIASSFEASAPEGWSFQEVRLTSLGGPLRAQGTLPK